MVTCRNGRCDDPWRYAPDRRIFEWRPEAWRRTRTKVDTETFCQNATSRRKPARLLTQCAEKVRTETPVKGSADTRRCVSVTERYDVLHIVTNLARFQGCFHRMPIFNAEVGKLSSGSQRANSQPAKAGSIAEKSADESACATLGMVRGASVREGAYGRRTLRCVTQCHRPAATCKRQFLSFAAFFSASRSSRKRSRFAARSAMSRSPASAATPSVSSFCTCGVRLGAPRSPHQLSSGGPSCVEEMRHPALPAGEMKRQMRTHQAPSAAPDLR